MAKRLQHRGGTTSQHSSFTGAVREVTVDTDKNTLVVHDGATAGGHPLATATNFKSTGIDDNATSTAITIDSNENVGIGVTPSSTSANGNTIKGLVIGDNNASGVFTGLQILNRVENSSTSNGIAIDFDHKTSASTTIPLARIVALPSSSTAGNLRFYTSISSSLSEVMRITSNGKIGIGTSSPGANLEISSGSYGSSNHHQQWSYNGTPFLSLYMDAYASPYFDTDSASSWNPGATMVFKRQGSEKMRITSDGNVGIGLTNPDSFHVSGNDLVVGNTTGGHGLTIVTSTNDAGSINFADGSSSNASYRGKITYEHSNDSLAFHTGATERFRVASNGNFSIKTTADSRTVNVFDSTPIVALYNSTTGTGNSDGFQLQLSSDDGYLWNYESGGNLIFGAGASERMRITSGGDVFIGDSNPDYSSRLTVSGNGSADTGLFMYDGSAGTFFNITTNGANGVVDLEANARTGSFPPLTFSTGANERMRITNSGNVGIGTSSPTAKLNVNGAIVGGQKGDSSPDNTDVSGVNSLTVSTGAGSQTINGLVGGVTGQVLHIIKTNSAFTLTIADQNATSPGVEIKTADGNNISLTNFGGVTLLFYNGAWWEVGK
jgi:hypothetical protein